MAVFDKGGGSGNGADVAGLDFVDLQITKQSQSHFRRVRAKLHCKLGAARAGRDLGMRLHGSRRSHGNEAGTPSFVCCCGCSGDSLKKLVTRFFSHSKRFGRSADGCRYIHSINSPLHDLVFPRFPAPRAVGDLQPCDGKPLQASRL